jgi:putative membrane protein
MEKPPKFTENRFLQILVTAYALVWIAAAINPLDRLVWGLENILVAVLVTILVVTYRRFAFSNLSYLLIALYLSLHAIGTHTGYAQTPIGFWLKDILGLARNPYDRIIHFSFGLLLAYPFYELVVRTGNLRRWAAHWSPVSIILAASVGFEVMESLIAEIVSPGTGPAWLGAQGDEWDMQFDLAAALLGALAVMPFTYWEERVAAKLGGPP